MANSVEIARAYVQIVPSLQGAQKTIATELNAETKDVGEESGKKIGSGMASGIGSALKAGATAVISAVTAIASAAFAGVVALTKQSISAYADFEQQSGAVEKLFGSSYSKLANYASDAWLTAGMSMNDYYETATGISGALITSLGGDTDAAVEYANRAMSTISDIANTYGRDIDDISGYYSQVALGQYKAIDTLTAGAFAGNQEGFENLIDSMAELTDVQDELGISVEAGAYTYDNFINALEVYNKSVGISGTTTKEALGTISGSVNATKASWTNFLTSLASDDIDMMSSSLDGLETAIFGVEGESNGLLNNIIPRVETVLNSLSGVITTQLPGLVQQILPIVTTTISTIGNIVATQVPAIITALLPVVTEAVDTLLESVGTILPSLITSLVDSINMLIPTVISLLVNSGETLTAVANGAISIITTLVTALSSGNAISSILQVAIDLVLTLVDGISSALPTIIRSASSIVLQIASTLTKPSNIKAIFNAITTVMSTITEVVSEVLPELLNQFIEFLPELLTNIIEGILSNLPMLIEGLVNLVISIVQALPTIILTLIEAIPTVVESVLNAIVECLPMVLTALVEAIPTLIDAILVQCLPQLFTTLAELYPTVITQLITIITNNLPTIIVALVDAATTLIGSLIQQLPSILEALWTVIVTILKMDFYEIPKLIVETLPTILTALGEVFTGVLNELVEFITGVWDWFFDTEIGKFLVNLGTVGVLLLDEIKNFLGQMISPQLKEFVSNTTTTISNFFSDIWNKVKTVFTNIFNTVKEKLQPIFNTVSNIFTNIYNTISNKIESAKNTVSNVINNMKTIMNNVFNNIYTSVSNIFNNIKQAISVPIENAKTLVSNGIEYMRNVINNAGFSLPHIDLPHFSISGSFSLDPPSVPKFSVSWYGKAYDAAQILTGAQIFGVQGGQLLAGGERGTEVVVGEQHLMDMISKASNPSSIVINVYASEGMDEESLAEKVAERLKEITESKEVVYA